MKARTKKILCLALTGTVILSCYLAAGTFARYTTTVGGKDTTRIARFGYEVNDGHNDDEFTSEGWATVDFFDDTETAAKGTVARGTNSQLFMAPGTYGSFQIEMNAKNVDVDLTMEGSEVKVVSGTSEATALAGKGLNVDTDKFLSYNIKYEKGTDTAGKDTPELAAAYTANRQTPAQMAADIKACMESVILEKGKVGIITVDWAWVDTNEYSYDDTQLGIKFCGTPGTQGGFDGLEYAEAAPELTLYVKNKATQIVTASTTAPVYTSTFNQPGREADAATTNSNEGVLDTYN